MTPFLIKKLKVHCIETFRSSQKYTQGGTWVVQLVGHLALDFGLRLGLGIMGLSPLSGFVLGIEPAWESLSPSPSALPCTMSLFLKNI